MSGSKIQLSKDELELVKNSAWILTKNLIIEKIVQGLGELSERMTELAGGMDLYAGDQLIQTGPRISRGERYQGLPYLVLDYPRIFGKEDIFAIRSFFWWGKHCSISIHCRGKFLGHLRNGIMADADLLLSEDFCIATAGDEWVHDLTAAPYQLIKNTGTNELNSQLQTAEFVRLGKIISLNQWPLMEEDFFRGFTRLIKTMRSD